MELQKIIAAVDPEVIFEELSYSNFHKCYIEDSLITLETNAIKRYMQTQSVEHIPVDTFELPDRYYEQIERMYDRIYNSNMIKESRQMRALTDQLDVLCSGHGFDFLNSDRNDAFFDRLSQLKEATLSAIKDESLFAISRMEKEVIEKREDQIIRNICNYTQLHAYNRALLLIGSGHRMSIIQKIREYGKGSEMNLGWTCYNGLDCTTVT